MIGHDFPYLDTRDINLDWLLKNMKLIIKQWADYQTYMNQQFSDLETAFNNLKDWIDGYFENLNVQTEINNKLDAMKESGELGEIMQPLISDETAAWLAAHITQPSTPAIDSSLTVAGAAADAKETGVRIADVKNGLKNVTGPIEASFLAMPYEMKIPCAFRMANVGLTTETYTESERAVCPVDSNQILTNALHIYNPDGYHVGVYRRLISDNSYAGYATAISTNTFFTVTTDISQYKYFIILRDENDAVWTADALSVAGGRIFAYSGQYVEEYSLRAVENGLSDVASNLNYTTYQIASYDEFRPYEKRIFGLFKTASVRSDTEVYEPYSRAVFKMDDAVIDGDIHFYNPNKYVVGVYRRQKIDNAYVDYVQTLTNTPYFKISTDISTYDYYVIARYTDGGEDTNWPADKLAELNRNLYIFSGKYIMDPPALPANLINKNMIHIGKYYYGATVMADNPNMAYTDLIPIKEMTTYYFPYLTLGYSWYASDGIIVLGGTYASVDRNVTAGRYIELTAPKGAAYIGVSCRTGDIDNMILSEMPSFHINADYGGKSVVLQSNVKKESKNIVYDAVFNQSSAPSRVALNGSWTYGTDYHAANAGASITPYDKITMDNSKIAAIFSIPSGLTPEFIFGYNGSHTDLAISDGAIAVLFKANGTQAEVRMGTGTDGNYATLLRTVDISALNIQAGGRFVVMIEKDTINKQIITMYNALAPDIVIEETLEASPVSGNDSAMTGQIRCWGTGYLKVISGSVNVYRFWMCSTAPTYPQIAIWGDSYVENAGRNPECGYGYLMKEELGGNAFLSGRGGATVQQAYNRFLSEVRLCTPRFVILNFGVNDSFAGNTAQYEEYINNMISVCKEIGAEPVLVTTPYVPEANTNVLAFCNVVNPWIRESGYRYIDIAYALSTGTETQADTDKYMADGIHPNLAGGRAILNYVKAFLPDLLLQ